MNIYERYAEDVKKYVLSRCEGMPEHVAMDIANYAMNRMVPVVLDSSYKANRAYRGPSHRRTLSEMEVDV